MHCVRVIGSGLTAQEIDTGAPSSYCMQNKETYTDIKTVTFSTRLEKEKAKRIDELAADLGLDRGALLKQLIRKGYKDIQTERALEGYRRGILSLSRAAEIAGLTLRDLLFRLPEESIELNYDLRELKRNLEGVVDEPGR